VTVASLADLEPVLSQSAGDDPTRIGVVIDHQNAPSATGRPVVVTAHQASLLHIGRARRVDDGLRTILPPQNERGRAMLAQHVDDDRRPCAAIYRPRRKDETVSDLRPRSCHSMVRLSCVGLTRGP
jgi:hypothetical protein